MQFYVGQLADCARFHAQSCTHFDLAHPKEFADIVAELRRSTDLAGQVLKNNFRYWTNRVEVLKHLKYEEVWFVGSDGIEKRAWEHPEFDHFKSLNLPPSDFWSACGENWQSVNMIPNSPQTQDRLNEIIGKVEPPFPGVIVKGNNPLAEEFGSSEQFEGRNRR